DSGVELASHPTVTPNASAGRSVCELHRETIELELSKGRNAKGVWQDLVDSSGFAGSYQSISNPSCLSGRCWCRTESTPEVRSVRGWCTGPSCRWRFRRRRTRWVENHDAVVEIVCYK